MCPMIMSQEEVGMRDVGVRAEQRERRGKSSAQHVSQTATDERRTHVPPSFSRFLRESCFSKISDR